MLKYIARRASDGREQSLLNHLQGTADLAAEFAASFGAEECGRLVGLAHDIGKYSEAFQLRVRGDRRRVDHATAGSRELAQMGAISAAFCVAGHHGGIPDGGDKHDSGDAITLVGRLNRELADYSFWQKELKLTLPTKPPEFDNSLEMAFFTRMLYSCLVDADYLDTEAFMSGGSVQRGGGDSIAVLLKKLNFYLEEKGFLKPQNNLNNYRAKILTDCIEQAPNLPGLFSLTVPTGGGKTIASLAFALNHAVQHGKERIIYVIPYCSIIDQTAEIFRSILGESNVLEHHSGVEYEVDECEYIMPKAKMALATENWDMPIIVTTSVQFFESFYANRSSYCRKLHNIANSVVIFDEAQMIPIPCLKPCVSAISQLVENYNTTAILCTATQPSLDQLFKELAPNLKRHEICSQTEALYDALKRVSFQFGGSLNNIKLAEKLQNHEQALCIVNNRRQAQEVFKLLEGEGNYHLSTLMHSSHRSKFLQEIRARLKEGLACRVVSTSLIEAGVDVDFPAVYRAEAGLDSILQAAGRCNREGKRSAAESIVTIFQPEIKPPAILAANIGAMREAVSRYPEVDKPQTIQGYFDTLLQLKGESALDKHGVLDGFRRGVNGSQLPFRTIVEKFKIIETTAKTVYIVQDAEEKLVKDLQDGRVSRSLFRKLGRYGVTVYPEHFAALEHVGDIEKISEQAAILLNHKLYSQETGLALEAEEGKGYMI